MNTINQTDKFKQWLTRISDKTLRGAVVGRINRVAHGLFGDCRDVGDGLWEMRIDLGGGIRIYYVRDGLDVYLLLDGGGKNGQSAQIAAAKKLWAEIRKDRRK